MIKKHQKGFTLIEVMIVAACLVILIGPILYIMRSGTKSSLSGMMRIETTLEARRVIKQIHADLKLACFPIQYGQEYNFGEILVKTGTPPENSYYFMSFPIHDRYDGIIDNRKAGIAYRNISLIGYIIEKNTDPNKPAYRLIREERYKNKKVKTRVLSEKVNFFDIEQIPIDVPNAKVQFYYLVTLQLMDTLHPKNLTAKKNTQSTKFTDHQNHVIMADFFDVVYPEYFHAIWNQFRVNPNWHTPVIGPDLGP